MIPKIMLYLGVFLFGSAEVLLTENTSIAMFHNRSTDGRCITSEAQVRHLFHLSTDEGLASHYDQLTWLWKVVKTVPINRVIIETPFESDHYNHKPVSMCDIFILPPEIQCSCASMQHIGNIRKYCPILVSKIGKPGDPDQYGLTVNTSAVTMNIDLKKTGCIAGSMYGLKYTKYESILHDNPLRLSMPVRFHQDYVWLAERVQRLLNARKVAYAAVHWRRGDQLTTRCVSQTKQHDDSVNCQSVKAFISTVKGKLEQLKVKHKRRFAIYIATNEQDPRELRQLHRAGYLTASNITTALQPHLQLSEIELFVLEMLIMCKAEHFWYWGRSTVHNLVLSCKEQRVDDEEIWDDT